MGNSIKTFTGKWPELSLIIILSYILPTLIIPIIWLLSGMAYDLRHILCTVVALFSGFLFALYSFSEEQNRLPGYMQILTTIVPIVIMVIVGIYGM